MQNAPATHREHLAFYATIGIAVAGAVGPLIIEEGAPAPSEQISTIDRAWWLGDEPDHAISIGGRVPKAPTPDESGSQPDHAGYSDAIWLPGRDIGHTQLHAGRRSGWTTHSLPQGN